MRVLVTGSRKWKDRDFVFAALNVVYDCWFESGRGGELIVVEGEAPGLDLMARWWARVMHENDARVDYEPHPAHWDLLGKAAGHIRNKEMVDLGATLCLAFPTPESIGTLDCMDQARAAGIPTFDMTEFLCP